MVADMFQMHIVPPFVEAVSTSKFRRPHLLDDIRESQFKYMNDRATTN